MGVAVRSEYTLFPNGVTWAVVALGEMSATKKKNEKKKKEGGCAHGSAAYGKEVLRYCHPENLRGTKRQSDYDGFRGVSRQIRC